MEGRSDWFALIAVLFLTPSVFLCGLLSGRGGGVRQGFLPVATAGYNKVHVDVWEQR